MNKLLKQTEFYIAVVIILLAIVITLFNPRFLSAENIFGLMKSYSVIGIMAVGELFVLILGGSPDVSFTAIAQVVEYVVVLMTLRWGGNIVLAFLIAAVLGALMGGFNGVLAHYFRVPTVIITIATLNIYYGLLYVFSRGEVIFVVHPMFREFANIKIGHFINENNVVYGFNLMPLIWILVLILGWYILRFTSIGRNVYAVGGNEIAAERVGINVFRTRLFVFSFIGFLSGIAAVVHAAIVQSAIPNSIVGQELGVIAAVFLGGASVFGGKGSVIGAFLGIMLFAIINNGLTLLGISTYWFDVFVGIVIIVSIAISAVQKIRQEKNRVRVHIEDKVVDRQ